MPTVSILLPNYNHAEFLPAALNGVCAQTRPADEILVLDDGSTDDSVAIVEGYARRYPNLRLLRNDGNRGLQYSINRLLEEARGDFIVCAAADDQLLPRFLERSLAALERHAGAQVCFSEFVVRQTDGEVINYSRAIPASYGLAGLPEYLSPAALTEALRDRYVWLSSNTAVVSRAALLSAGGFRPQLEWHSDWFAYYGVALRSGACVVHEGLTVIRANPGGYSDRGMNDKHRQQHVLSDLVGCLKSPPCADLLPVFRARPALLSVFGWNMLHVLARSPRHWDLLFPYLAWGLNLYRIHRGLSWPRLCVALIIQACKRAASYTKLSMWLERSRRTAP